jgi:signal transduction histidine kinase
MNKAKILILEDETITAHHLRRVLGRLGYEVVGVAANGASALEQIEQTRPDLLLADVGLEGEVDGIEVASCAQREHRIPAVFLTAYSDPETLQRAKLTEPYGFLVKPFAEKELDATIQIALQQTALRQAQEQHLAVTGGLLVNTREELAAVSARLLQVQEQEREEIAKDLHDDLGQRISLLQVSMERLWQKLPSGFRDDNSRELERIIREVGALATALRDISHRLHPTILKDLGVVVALRQLAETFEERRNTPTRFSARDIPDNIEPTIGLALYRIVQEGLHNIAKHAGEKTMVTIMLIGRGETLELTIRDTGKGFEPQDMKPLSGLGLMSMAHRATVIGGQFAITSVPGQGTVIQVTIPLTNPEPHDIE